MRPWPPSERSSELESGILFEKDFGDGFLKTFVRGDFVIGIFTVVAALLLTAGSAEASPDCYGAGRFEEFKRDFLFEQDGSASALDYRECDQRNLAFRVLEGLSYLKDLAALSSVHDDFAPGFADKAPIEFLRERIEKINLVDESEDACSRGAAAYVVFGNQEKRMNVCPRTLTSPLIMVASTLVHEARHIDGFLHVTCNHGLKKSAQIEACDQSYGEGGSYAVEVELYIRTSRTEGVNESHRNAARGHAIGYLIDRFNDLPLEINLNGALIFTEDNLAAFYDGKDVAGIIKADKAWRMVSYRQQDRAMFRLTDPSNGLGLSHDLTWFEEEPKTHQFIRDDFDQFRDMLRQNDMHCWLNRRDLSCQGVEDSKDRHVVELHGYRGASLVLTSRSSFVEPNQLYVVDEDGDYHEVPNTLKEFKRARSLKSTKIKIRYRDLGPLNEDQEIGLDAKDGQVVIYDPKTKEWTKNPGFEGIKVKKVISPFPWSMRFDEI